MNEKGKLNNFNTYNRRVEDSDLCLVPILLSVGLGVFEDCLEGNAGYGDDDVGVVLLLQALVEDLHVEQAQEP